MIDHWITKIQNGIKMVYIYIIYSKRKHHKHGKNDMKPLLIDTMGISKEVHL